MELLPWLLVFGLVCLPGIALGLAVRLPPIYRLTQCGRGARLAMLAAGLAVLALLGIKERAER